MIKAIIVEDEAVAARRIKKLLEQLDVDVIGLAHTNKELQSILEEGHEAELFLMDINLSDGLVFNTLNKIDLQTPIIFTTAYDEYAIKAFKQNSIDYLLKPIDKEELKTAIEKFKSIHQQGSALDLSKLSALLTSERKSYRERIRVKVGDRIRSFKMSEISMIYSANKLTFLANETGRSYPIDYSVDSISEELDPATFHRINRSHIVNIDFIKDIVSYSNSRLKVKIVGAKADDIIVARERVKAFKAWLG